MKKYLPWFIGAVIITALLFINLYLQISLLERLFNVLLLSAIFCLMRVVKGPTAADRAVAIDILGIILIGFCALLAITTKRDFFIDIAIAWALQSFIGALALAKYLEGKGFEQ
ncbi:MAG: Na(+)/H(+) antiporter subunit F [candidate division WS2 bacterium]|nr:Na(+)/H(+) antiporter subunit F [Candidatus Lithacetigena glycinireducens]